MNYVENSLQTLVLIVSCYLAGRFHQWYKRATDDALEYRRGYEDSAESLFALALKLVQGLSGRRARGIARVTGSVTSTAGSSHSAEDRGSRTVRINHGDNT